MSSEFREISNLKTEVETIKKELRRLKRAILNVPELGEKVQKKLWET